MKRIAALSLALCLALCACGSRFGLYSNISEVERLQLVKTMGVDLAAGGVTVSADAGDAEEGEPVLYLVQAATMAEAARRLEKNAMKYDANISHTEHVIIGEEAARQGIGEFLDYVARTMQMRLDTCLFIARGVSAEEVVTGARGADSGVSEMLTSLKKDAPYIAGGGVTSCQEAAAAMAKGEPFLLRAVTLAPSEEQSAEERYRTVRPAGCAVISGGRLAGFAPEEDAEAAGILTGTVVSGCRVVRYRGLPVTLLLTGVRSRLEPRFDGGSPGFTVDVFLRYSIQGAAPPLRLSEPRIRAALASAAAEAVRGELTAAIERAKAMKCDYLGIGSALAAAAPLKMEQVRRAWQTLFPDAKFEVRAEAVLQRSYDLTDPVP